MRILVVEDEVSMSELLRKGLEEERHSDHRVTGWDQFVTVDLNFVVFLCTCAGCRDKGSQEH